MQLSLMKAQTLPAETTPSRHWLPHTKQRQISLALWISINVIILILLLSWKTLLALYHQQQGGKLLAEIIPTGTNDYGGFACLRPFIEDPDQRAVLKQAVVSLRKAETLSPQQSHTYYLIGKTDCLLGDYENAVLALQRFSDLRPNNPSAMLEMGFALLEACPPNGKCANGLNTYDTWRKTGVRAEDFAALGEKARAKGDYETALLWYQNAQRMGMELRSTIAYLRYLIYKNMENKAEANLALQSAVEMDQGWLDGKMRIDVLIAYARSLFDQQKWKKAEKYFQIIIQSKTTGLIAPATLSEIYRLLGLTLNAQGKLAEAVPYLRKAVEIYPPNLWAHIHYGKFLYYYDPTAKNETVSQFNQALNLTSDPAIYANLIQFWAQVNQPDQIDYLCQQARLHKIDPGLLEKYP